LFKAAVKLRGFPPYWADFDGLSPGEARQGLEGKGYFANNTEL
jgi:hypothetical protein